MKLLYFVQGKTPDDHIGFHDAFKTLMLEGQLSDYKTFPWRGYVNDFGWVAFFKKAIELTIQFKPDIVYFQFFHQKDCPDVSGFFGAIRSVSSRPIIVISAGDTFSGSNYIERRYPSGFISAARNADLTFLSEMGKAADYLADRGVCNIALLPLGVCQVRFLPKSINLNSYKPDYDVVFIGGGGRWYRNHLLNLSFYSGLKRDLMVRALQKRYGRRFGLFGHGWNGKSSWQGPISFANQIEVCRQSFVVFGGCPGSYNDYYASDRPFIQGVSGIPLVDWYVPRTDKILRDQEHWYLVNDKKSMLKQIDLLIESDVQENLKKAERAAEYIIKKLSHLALMRFFLKTVSDVRIARQNGRVAELPAFGFLLSSVNLESESNFLLRNWKG